MTTEETQKANILFAEFMGACKVGRMDLYYASSFPIEFYNAGTFYRKKIHFSPSELRYHESFEWIIPVVKKIKETFKSIPPEIARLHNDSINFQLHILYIDALYLACLNYISWYFKLYSEEVKKQYNE